MTKIKLEDVRPLLNICVNEDNVDILGNSRTSLETSEHRFELVEQLLSKPRHSFLKAWDYFDKLFGPFDNLEGHSYRDYGRLRPTKELLEEWFPLPENYHYVSLGNLAKIRWNEGEREISFLGLIVFYLCVTRNESRNKAKKKQHYEIRDTLAEIFSIEPVNRVAYSAQLIVTRKVGSVIGKDNALLIVRSFQRNDTLKKTEAEQLAEEILEVYRKTSLEKTIELFVDPAHLPEV